MSTTTSTTTTSLTPRFCTGGVGPQRAVMTPWEGELLRQENNPFDKEKFPKDIFSDCRVLGVFRGAVDDEWSVWFTWYDLDSVHVFAQYWAEVWYDHEDGLIHCLVRRCHQTEPVYGPNPAELYYRAPTCTSLHGLATLLETRDWERATATPNCTLDAERDRSRGYKRIRNERHRIAVAMALHPRLGEGSPLASLSVDLLSQYVLRIL